MEKKRFYNGSWHDICPPEAKIDYHKLRIATLSKMNGIYRLDQLETYKGAIVKTSLGNIGKVYFDSAPEHGKLFVYFEKDHVTTLPHKLEVISFF